MTFTTTEAALLAALLGPRIEALADLHRAQVQALPPGDCSWAETEEELERAACCLAKCEALQ
jgi:hypothetical protein